MANTTAGALVHCRRRRYPTRREAYRASVLLARTRKGLDRRLEPSHCPVGRHYHVAGSS